MSEGVLGVRCVCTVISTREYIFDEGGIDLERLESLLVWWGKGRTVWAVLNSFLSVNLYKVGRNMREEKNQVFFNSS